MKLELKHLAPYLPYGLKIIKDEIRFNVAYLSTKRIAYINQENDLRKMSWEYASGKIKPILRPLSDLEEDNSEWGKHFCTKVEYHQGNVNTMFYSDVEGLLEKHYDVFGLIEKGLAIDINTL